MTEPDPVLDALLQALEREDHPDLHLAVGRHLLAAGRDAEALDHLRAVLAARPADLIALPLAAEAAEGAGEADAAAGYRRLASALGAGPPVTPVPVGPGPATADDDDDEYDAFLREVMAEAPGPPVRLTDVGGMAQVKAELERRFFLPLRNPGIQRAYGKPVGGGLLLYGPPGCGKTYLARAIAGELDAAFVPVTLHDTLDMWLGNSEQNLHKVFTTARAQAPAVLFLDEVDAIGQKRSRITSGGMRNVVTQLLNELDGAIDRNDGLFVVAATNAPWDVDPALRRPGRLDRTVLVLPPDAEARASILATHLRDRPTVGLDLDRIAERTRNLSGADLKLICDTATELAMERAVRSGRVEPIDQKLLEKAAKGVKPSVGPWLDTARNFVTFANLDGEYDDLERYLSSQGR